MTKKQIITILAPYSWSAAIVPVTITTLFYLYHGGSFRLDLIVAILLAAVLGQSFTNIVNCYSDFMSGLDTEDTIFDSAGSVIVGEGVDPKDVKKLMGYVFIISIIPILYLTYIRGPLVLIFGGIGVISGLIYSTGPLPISTTPIGEIYSGVVDGFFISGLSYFIYSGGLSWEIFFIAIPAVLWVTTMTFTNSICDMEKDRSHRLTLALFLGKEMSILALKLFYLGMFSFLIGAVAIGLLPVSMLLLTLTLPLIWKRLTGITTENTNMRNKFPIMGLSCGSGIIFFKVYALIMAGEIIWRGVVKA